ncbi:MAG: hypothetical protein K0S16_2028 [Moraxellaceae bacterium]|nr:hypothetical protein [Moraxellaceae bacterium]
MTLSSVIFYPSLYKELEAFKSELADQQKDIKKRQEFLTEMRKASAEGLKGAEIFEKYQQILEPSKEKPNKNKQT